MIFTDKLIGEDVENLKQSVRMNVKQDNNDQINGGR